MKNTQRYFMEEWLMAIILIVQVSLVCAGVLSRYVFNWSLSFTEELTRYLLIWLTCLGFPAGYARGEMIRFQWPGGRSGKMAAIRRWIGIGAGFVFAVVLLISSLQSVHLQWKYNQQTSVLGWPIIWVSLALPAAAVLFLIRMIPRFRAQADSDSPETME
ncbi:MAG: TRAP transporter small permease [Candidatus Omnitrophica bacterium]|nr:TRAP transporter small permease [Candidatus Omnitrophota bacterium]